jgi:hypothetical protein
MLLILTTVSILRGSGDNSPVGVERCDSTDWILFAVLQVACVAFELRAIWVIRHEYNQKVEHHYQFLPGEFKGSNIDICRFAAVAFFGSCASVFCGGGPGAVMGPFVVAAGIEP